MSTPAAHVSRRLWLRAAGVAALLLAAQPLAHRLVPRRRAGGPTIDLPSQVPLSFGPWRVDPTVLPLLPDPVLQQALADTYTQVLARAYVDDQGQRVLLAIAYGVDQSRETSAVHRPEFCYRAQGFDVRAVGVQPLRLPDGQRDVMRLVATSGPRREPITYWVTLGEAAVLPGLRRKLEQLRQGLQGHIVDGMLVRVSSFDRHDTTAFALHDAFLGTLHATLEPGLRSRYFGRPGASATGQGR
ncbi:MAG: exosortase-associated protein EpsI, B-type [Aquabacterium sp.]